VICSIHDGNEKRTTFSSENMNGIEHLGRIGVNGRILLKWMIKENMRISTVHLTEDMVQWWTGMKIVMIL